MVTSWKTTLAGLLAGLPLAIQALVDSFQSGQLTGKSGVQLLVAIGLILFGAYAKDKNVTGGTKQQ